MRKKTKFVAMMCAGTMMLTGANVFASAGQSVGVSIQSNQTSASSARAIWNCQGKMQLSGKNKASSTNSLYVQCYEQRNNSMDRKEQEMLVNVNKSDSYKWNLSSYNSGKAYYVKLNPKGALSKGCNGSGTLYD